MNDATKILVDLALRLTPSGEIGDGMVGQLHAAAMRVQRYDPPGPAPAGIPPFVVLLPQRAAAFRALRQFADREGFATYETTETLHPGVPTTTVTLVGEAPGGKRWTVGYEWTDRDIDCHVMGRS